MLSAGLSYFLLRHSSDYTHKSGVVLICYFVHCFADITHCICLIALHTLSGMTCTLLFTNFYLLCTLLGIHPSTTSTSKTSSLGDRTDIPSETSGGGFRALIRRYLHRHPWFTFWGATANAKNRYFMRKWCYADSVLTRTNILSIRNDDDNETLNGLKQAYTMDSGSWDATQRYSGWLFWGI